jgi:3' terminal RNA ribose 2'-O-methyltransferase Hen1
MLLEITSTASSATDLGYLLHKNPANVRSVDLAFGRAHVFYPEASPDRCTAALLVEVDPIGLVRRGRGRPVFALAEYVNDRPYVASSFLSTAIAKVYGTALSGRADGFDTLAATPLPLDAHLPVVGCRGGEKLARELFEPLGYEVTTSAISLDPTRPGWGESRYLDLRLRAEVVLRDLLRHLYVLLPVMDDDKHYWVERSEIDKLLAKGGDWLGDHPQRELIARRYLRHKGTLLREALARLTDEDALGPDEPERREDTLERDMRLGEHRIGAVVSVLRTAGARSVIDLGCGAGKLLQALIKERALDRITGVDVSVGALEAAGRRLHVEEMSPRQRERVTLIQGALTYRDARFAGYDAAVLMEVIEHLDPERLPALEQTVFHAARPVTVVVTTPNAAYNVRFEGLPEGAFRHRDHRFEWDPEMFGAWANGVAERAGYRVRFLPVGAVDPEVGPPTQMAVFER